MVDTDKTEVSQEVTQNLVENLPIVGRRWDNFVLLTPGVTTDGGLVSYRGISGLYNNNSVDGANNNQAFFSEARGRSTVPYTYSHRFDSGVSGQLQQLQRRIRAGGRRRGQRRHEIRHQRDCMAICSTTSAIPSLNALDPDQQGRRYSNAGQFTSSSSSAAASAAPVIKDKLFYFFTYDGSRKVFPVSYTSTAFPTPPVRTLLARRLIIARPSARRPMPYLRGNLGSLRPRTACSDVGFRQARLPAELHKPPQRRIRSGRLPRAELLQHRHDNQQQFAVARTARRLLITGSSSETGIRPHQHAGQ